jgi:Zn-dependent M28 family amino/carboxypeptidase
MTKIHSFWRGTLLAAVLVAAAAAQETKFTPMPRPGPDVASLNPSALDAEITVESLSAPLRFLADDQLEGRGVGSRGDSLARHYLATQLQLFGLQPGGPGGSWSQPVPIVAIKSGIATPLEAAGASGKASFTAPDDYVAWAAKPGDRTEWKDAEIVFVGYGINAPEQKWDDYKGADLKGKVLLFMNDDPSSDPALFAGKTRLYYGRWSYKFEEAARQGAVGAIIIHTTPSAGYPFQVIQAKHQQEQFWLPFDKEESVAIQSWVSEDCAKKIATLGGQDLDALRAKAETRDFRPVPLGVTASLTTANEVRKLESGNVAGILPGSDSALGGETVVVTAHFDHLGIGAPKGGDSIYNGALDNASGCAVLVNLAQALTRVKPLLNRSILFLAVTGEESGLLGSAWYARNPTIPAKKIVANFNIDGVNIWGRSRDLQLVGYGKSSLTELAQGIATRRGRKVVPDSEPDKGLFYRSDHFSFAKVGVPSAYFKAGTDFLDRPDVKKRIQLAYTATHYHQPSDQFDARWDLTGAVEDAQLLLECLVETANAREWPKWAAGDEFEKLR